MITDSILLLLQGIVNVLLAPLELINIGIDFISSIPIVTSFLQVIFYILPMDNLSPLFFLTISLFVFRAGIALIKTIWDLLPIL